MDSHDGDRDTGGELAEAIELLGLDDAEGLVMAEPFLVDDQTSHSMNDHYSEDVCLTCLP